MMHEMGLYPVADGKVVRERFITQPAAEPLRSQAHKSRITTYVLSSTESLNGVYLRSRFI
jgi:hypothetical protein